MTPHDLIDIEEIRRLKARYFRLMDQKKWDEWRDVFTEDVVIDTSDEGTEIIRGRDNFIEFLEPILTGVHTTHHGHMPEIEITSPGAARGTWSMEDHLEFPDGGGHLWGTGWYHEEYRKGSDGRWRIASLQLRRIRVTHNGVQTFPPSAS